jgi:hypothetical protein
VIDFWTTGATARVTIDTYRRRRGRAIAGHFRTRAYDEAWSAVRVRSGPQIFAALERASAVEREVAARIWDAHAELAPGAARLNDPRRAPGRFDLLRTLFGAGINRFNVWRAAEYESVDRFPVFIRVEADHFGPRSRLLRSHAEIATALSNLQRRGRRIGDLIVVEFCDTSDRDGVFRKYAAFNVGGRILACHAMAAHEWSVKSGQLSLDEAVVEQELAFVETNPHEAALRRVFELAGIDYGRADYGLMDGAVQVWEINLNPTIGRLQSRHDSLPPAVTALRERVKATFHERLQAAFIALDGPDDEREALVPIAPALRSRLRREALIRQPREWAVRHIIDGYLHPSLGRPLRTFYRGFVKRKT